MRIRELNLIAFGPFEGLSIDLSQGNHGLHIIYGPNEAGKSSALRALRQVFYGIPVRSDDNFKFAHNKMRIGATICSSDEKTIRFIRRKGKSNTLRGEDDKTILDDAILAPILKGVDASLFSAMFGIDHDDLVNGGKEIIKGGGNLGQLIFAAGSGITSLRDVQTELQNNADALFKPTGKLPKINETIRRIKENRKLIRDSQLASGIWVKHDQALQTALKDKKILAEKLTAARAEKNRLERIRDSLPIIAQRIELIKMLQPYLSAVLLPDNFGKQRREHMSNLTIAEKDQAQSLENIRHLQNEINQLNISNLILQNAGPIESIYQELGGFGKAAKDRIQLLTRMDILHSDAKLILRNLREDLSIDDADNLRLNKKDTLHIQDLGIQYERIITRIETTRKEIPRLNHEIQTLRTRISQLQTPRQVEKLEQVIEQAAEYAPIEKQYLEELEVIKLTETTLENELARQAYWSGTLDELEQLQIPSAESIDVFESEFETISHSMRSLKTDIQQLASNLTETIRITDELNLNFTVPTESDLDSARTIRDNGWQLISDKLNQSPASENLTNEFLKQFPLADNLTGAYENSVVSADEIADRLRREADRVATLAKLLSEKSHIEKQLAVKENELTALEKKLDQVTANWVRQWSFLNTSPATPKEMRAWALKKQDMTSRLTDIRNRKSKTKTHETAINAVRQKLSQVFASVNEPIAETFESLGDLLKRGRRFIAREQDLAERQKQLKNEESQKQTLLDELKTRTQTNEKALFLWQQQWEQAVAPLGLDANTLPAHANAFLEELKTLFDKLKEADVLQKRINGIDRDAAAFHTRVNELINIAARDLADYPADKAVVELSSRLSNTRTADSKKQTLEQQVNRENLRVRQSAKAITDIQAFLKTMCEDARCESYKELSEAENRSNRRREIESELKTAETQLLKLSAGAVIEDFIKESLSIEPDNIASEIDTLCETIDTLTKEKSDIDQAIGSERTELRKMDGSARSAMLAEETQTLLGSLEENVEAYVRFKMAAAILNQAIERFRDKNQSPVLQKASAFFSQITGGSFEGIRAEFDDSGNPIIAGVRGSNSEIVNVSGMSDGTADQLYLSLRLAGLEAYLDKNGPIPFIVDDILIKFDTIRAQATLSVLATLSAKTQIIFFTHNHHLVDLAQKHIDPSVLITHSLSI